jgi:hypothetical protein
MRISTWARWLQPTKLIQGCVQASFFRRRHHTTMCLKQERADPQASTQLIDDFGGSGIPLRRAKKILTSLLADTRLQFFGNQWRFLDNRSGESKSVLIVEPQHALLRKEASDDVLPSPSPPAQKATARQDQCHQARQSSTGDGAGNRYVRRYCAGKPIGYA